MTLVADTGPLLFLAKIERLDLLRRRFSVSIPDAVAAEIGVKDDQAAAAITANLGAWIEVRSVKDRAFVEFLSADLGPGEAEVIALARETGIRDVLLDDQDARRFARRHGLDVIGTLGVLAAAKVSGWIASVAPEIARLKTCGFHVREDLVDAVLRRVGESPVR